MPTTQPAFHIEGEMTIYRAVELRQELQPLIEPGSAPAIAALDLSAVTDIDSSGVQLLLLARRAAAAAGAELRLANPSSPVAEVFALMGIDYVQASGA